ncbi:HEXXH motif domain-containing protein [Bradyrhizobium sp. 61]|uniref:aKG-HExxH-type peptide beta-hydroxylase n=1 Tax=unclassified Bradyrhizobium TaxID=2631580 RepID=UPI001FF99D4B|nr:MULTISPECIES: HEXXH motif-containing putative peptide modification protein [unclassified Bradyrhizobium]MCK1280172.1 HEXXH motif domain-containing protein [Bradyrhizobium sp. 61]MCK1443961.1 HEXXH motif domain-containing protein [Bradyrhizobium sp. 48]MCK1462745.1 HEXXH motif domain-containing protein [Bradyrhizobium sp. 2]
MDATSIDWERTARPQADGYDTAVALGLIDTEPTPWRPLPPQRPPVNGAPAIAEGRVVLRTEDPLLPAPRFVPDALAIPALEQALHYVRRWPLAAKQWPDIVHTIQCYHDTEQPTEGPGRLGSASHSVDARFGVIGLTVNCPLATAQAIVHEMAHHKLRAFGVANENAIRIISNPQDELYPSPIVVDRPRPMTAVLHAQYSFIHVTQLDVHMLEQEDDPQVRSDIRALLARNASRMEQGFETLRQHARTDAAGRAFLGAFFAWCSDVLASSRTMLASERV